MIKTIKFRIEYISEYGPVVYLLARQLDKGNFSLSPSSKLGGVLIKPFLSQPRKLRDDGSLDQEVFVFVLAEKHERAKFFIGQIVEFSP